MSNRVVGRVLVAIVSSGLILGLLAAPVAAAGHANRWVDDDVVAGDGPANCDSAAYTSIQDAIDASSAGDWVYVCPGTYTEQLTIPAGVKVRARPLRLAHLVAPTDGTGTIVTLTGDGARVRGLRIQVATTSCPVFSVSCATIAPTCAHYATAILALGNDDVIRDNYIEAVGDSSLTGPCGYDYGIVVGNHGDSATARVTFNWVVDFKAGGILVEDDDSYAFVRRNTVRFFHENECAAPAITICTVTIRPSVNNSFSLAFGIGIESNARADISKNWVGSGPNACTGLCNTVTATTPALSDGISLTGLDGSETTNVYDNVVERAIGGIVTRDATDGADLYGNYVYGSHYGYQIGGSNDEWHDNHTSGNEYGASVGQYASGNNIHDNDFRGNTNTDCTDQSSGAGTEHTANTWTSDLGNTDSPDGICTPDI